MARTLSFALFVLALASEMIACTNPPGWTVQDDIDRADAIFTGEVERIELRREWAPYSKGQRGTLGGVILEEHGLIYEPGFIFTIAVDKAWKGVRNESVVVTTGWSSCGARVDIARRYLFYAYKTKDGGLAVGSLSTRALGQASRDLELLGQPMYDFLAEKAALIKQQLTGQSTYREPPR